MGRINRKKPSGCLAFPCTILLFICCISSLVFQSLSNSSAEELLSPENTAVLQSNTPTENLIPIISHPTDTPGPISYSIPLPEPNNANCLPRNSERDLAQVVQIIDGDTIEVFVNGELQIISYLGVVAPEMNDFFGDQSIQANRSLVENQIITLVKDSLQIDQQSELRYVLTDTLFINYELIKNGFAKASTNSPEFVCGQSFIEAQSLAQIGNIGLWIPTSIPPTQTPIPTTAPVPTQPSINSSNATAICNDGTYSYSAHRRGTCSHHGGVAIWLKDVPP